MIKREKLIKITQTRMVFVPEVPNFIHAQENPDNKVISIADLSNDDLKAIGSAWITDLLNRAEEIRNNRKTN